jgi:hypothetical protein
MREQEQVGQGARLGDPAVDWDVSEPAGVVRKPRNRNAPRLPRRPAFDRPEDAEGGKPTRKRVAKRAARKNGKGGLTPRTHRAGNHRKAVKPKRQPRA